MELFLPDDAELLQADIRVAVKHCQTQPISTLLCSALCYVCHMMSIYDKREKIAFLIQFLVKMSQTLTA